MIAVLDPQGREPSSAGPCYCGGGSIHYHDPRIDRDRRCPDCGEPDQEELIATASTGDVFRCPKCYVEEFTRRELQIYQHWELRLEPRRGS